MEKRQSDIIKYIVCLALASAIVYFIIDNIYLNSIFFMSAFEFNLSLFYPIIDLFPIPNVVYILAAFLGGMFFAYALSLVRSYKSGKTIENLQNTCETQNKEIAELKEQLEKARQQSGSVSNDIVYKSF